LFNTLLKGACAELHSDSLSTTTGIRNGDKTYRTKRVKEKRKEGQEEEWAGKKEKSSLPPPPYGPTCSECRGNGDLICVYRLSSYCAVNCSQ
jgi:hypothetical protein